MVTLCLSAHSFVSLELYCKDHFAAGMSQIPVLPILVLRECKVCLSSPCWAETKPSGRSASASRKNGWQVQRNLEEGEPLGKETPVDAWEELQEAMRHSSSLPLTPKHSWHCMCHPWQPAFTETHLLLQLFEYHLQLHKMSGQPSKSSCCSECKSAVQCKARRCCPPTTPRVLLGSLWKYRYRTSKGFWFCHTRNTKAQDFTVLKHCCVILFKGRSILSHFAPLLKQYLSVKCAGYITGFALGQKP